MTKKFVSLSIAGLATLLLSAATGCLTYGPTVGVASVPAPVSVYLQDEYEKLAYEKARYEKVAILPPITDSEHIALDPPTDDHCVRTLAKIKPIAGSVPGTETTIRNINGITKELIADYVDPPRVLPLVGPVQVHHAHYKITVYYQERTNVGWPIPYTITVEDGVESFYIDKDHLHRVAGPYVDAPQM